jgi:hypothetical protein
MPPLSRAFPALGALALVLLGATASGCYSKATAYEGKFTFAYASGLEFDNFVKPIAPGAKLDVVAFANGTEDKLVITAAKSSKPNVLAVDKVNDKTLVLKAGEPGIVDLEVTARDAAGNTLVDKMFFHVAKPTVHALEHACTDGRDAVYVKGERVDIRHRLATSDGRLVIGYAYTPIRVEPQNALDLMAAPQGANTYFFRARAKTERVSIKSTVDDSAVSMRIVERGELKDASLDCGGDCRLLEGEEHYVVARVRFGASPVCSQNALTKARSLTPEICAVTAKLDGDDERDENANARDDASNDGSNRYQLASITGKKLGMCKYEVTLPELDGGRGVRLTGEAKIGRVQFPGEGGGSSGTAVDQAVEHAPLLRRTLTAWLLVGLGWTAPNLVVLACIGWAVRRRRRRSSSPAPSLASSGLLAGSDATQAERDVDS